MKPLMRRSRQAWPTTARTAAAIIAMACLVLSAAACSGIPPSTGAGGSTIAQGSANAPLLAFSQCMRSHGVPNFPDPRPTGDAKFPSAQQLGVSSPRYQAAESNCQDLLPTGVNDEFPPAEVQQLLIGMRTFSQCLRSHGEPNWPDPIVDSDRRPVFDLGAHGVTRSEYHSQQLQTKLAECQHLLPSALGGTPVGGP